MALDLVDFHSHILPGVDHGSNSQETTRAQLELAARYGVSRIIATSHFYPHKHTLPAFLEKRNSAYKKLSELSDLPNIEIKLGAEVLLCENLDALENLKDLCIYGTDYLLLELPFNGFSDALLKAVVGIMSIGIKVILAHADRYSPDIIESLLAQGAKIQLNASSLTTFLKNKTLYSWIERDLVVGIGSDIHRDDQDAYKKFDKAKKKLGEKLMPIIEYSDEIWKSARAFS